MATQAERRADTRQRLVNAAGQLFERHGFEAVSVDQIVKTANVAKGTFYQYYQTKIDILTDVTRDEGLVKIRQALAKAADGAPALEILKRYVRAQCDWFESHEKVAAALTMAALKTIGNDIEGEEDRYNRVFLTKLITIARQQGSIRKDIDPREVAKLIGGALVISVLAWSKQPAPGLLQGSMKQSLDIILNGAKTES